MNFMAILACLGAAGAAFFGLKAAGKVGDKVEDRKRGTMKLALWARENGLPLLEQLLEDYTVDAGAELVGSIRRVIDIIRDPAQSQAALDTFLQVQLTKALSSEAGTKKVIDLFEEVKGVKIDRDALVQTPTVLNKTNEELAA